MIRPAYASSALPAFWAPRLAWVGLALAALAGLAAGMSLRVQEVLAGEAAALPVNTTLAWFSVLLDGVFVAAFVLLGTLIVWQASRRARSGAAASGSRQRAFAYLVAFALLILVIRLPREYHLLIARLPAGEAINGWFNAVGYAIFPLLLALFPNGRWVPRRIWIYPLAGLAFAVFIGVTGWRPVMVSVALSTAIEILDIGVGVAAQIYRYQRAASPLERQQTKWALFGIGVTFVLY